MLVFELDYTKREVMDMARKRHTIEQIINHLREAEVELSRGKSIADDLWEPACFTRNIVQRRTLNNQMHSDLPQLETMDSNL